MSSEKKGTGPNGVYSVADIADILNVGKTAAYELCRQAPFRVVRIGRSIRVSAQSFHAWLNSADEKEEL